MTYASSSAASAAAGFLSICLALPGTADAQSYTGVELRELTTGVYAVLAEDGAGNGAVIVGRDEIMVIDTQVVPLLAEAVIQEIKSISDLPVTRVLNTHWHIDHSHGNSAYQSAFGEDISFLAHPSTSRDMEERAAEQLGFWPGFYGQGLDGLDRMIKAGTTAEGVALGEQTLAEMRGQLARKRRYLSQMEAGPKLVFPNHGVSTDTSLVVGGVRVDIIQTPGHTTGGLTVYLPESQTLISGDLILAHIFVQDATPRQFLHSLRVLERLDIMTIVPGHGPLLHGRQPILERAEALQAIVNYVEKAVLEGLDADETLQNMDRNILGVLVPQLEAVVAEVHKNSRP